MVVRFWEARIAAGRLDDALSWTKATLLARAKERPGFVSGQVFVADEVIASALSAEEPARIVLLTSWTENPGDLDETPPDDGSVERAHGWFFRSA